MVVNLLGVLHAELRVCGLAQRQIDGELCAVGQLLGFSLGAYEHHVKNLFGQLGDDLLQNLLLRVDELRLQLRTVAQRFVAHQVELLFLSVLVDGFALGNVYERAIGDFLAHLALRACLAQTCLDVLIHTVGDGADGGHRHHLEVLHRTDIEVGIGSHHGGIAAGADVVADGHRVGVGLAARHVEDEVRYRQIAGFRCVDETHRGACAAGCGHGTCVVLQRGAHRQVEDHACHQHHAHRVGIVQRGALGQCVRAVGSGRVAQDVEEDGLAVGQDVLAGASGEHVEHVAVEGFGLVVGAVLLYAKVHALQGAQLG